VLFRTGKTYVNIKKELLENCNLHTIISLPPGVFANVSSSGQGPKTNLLFFEKGKPTEEIWYYELNPPAGIKYTKKNPILDEHTADALEKWQKKTKSENSWAVKNEGIISKNYDLSAKNPNGKENLDLKKPEELIKNIIEKEDEIKKILNNLNL